MRRGSEQSKEGQNVTETIIRAVAELIANATMTLIMVGGLWFAGYRIKFERRDVDKSSST